MTENPHILCPWKQVTSAYFAITRLYCAGAAKHEGFLIAFGSGMDAARYGIVSHWCGSLSPKANLARFRSITATAEEVGQLLGGN